MTDDLTPNSPNQAAPPPLASDQEKYDSLVKQYQDLLDNYSDEVNTPPEPMPQLSTESPPLSSPSVSPPTSPPAQEETTFQDINPETTPPPSASPDISLPHPIPENPPVPSEPPLGLNPLPVPDPAKLSLPPLTPPPSPSLASSTVSDPDISDLPKEPLSSPPEVPQQPSSGSSLFKYLFFLSLLIFLGVCISIAYVLFSYRQSAPSNPVPVAQPSLNPEPTTILSSAAGCSLNDVQYQAGETFSAADGCNTCTCQEDQIISCTQNSCEEITNPPEPTTEPSP
jgi:hypothetical protein